MDCFVKRATREARDALRSEDIWGISNGVRHVPLLDESDGRESDESERTGPKPAARNHNHDHDWDLDLSPLLERRDIEVLLDQAGASPAQRDLMRMLDYLGERNLAEAARRLGWESIPLSGEHRHFVADTCPARDTSNSAAAARYRRACQTAPADG